MGAAPVEFSSIIRTEFQANFKSFPFKSELTSIKHQPMCKVSGIGVYPCLSASKGYGGRLQAFRDGDDDSLWEENPTPILDMVENPIHLKNLSIKELKQLAEEIRSELSLVVPKMQKALKASLAAVELTIAIHYVFHAPMDKILWDAGEQTYAHKLVTGRRSLTETMWLKNGFCGHTSPSESEYDPFGAAHGCNSISAGLGMAVARDIKGRRERIVTIISNTSTMAGQLYEAMSNAGYLDSNLVVILNDTRHSLHPKPEEDGSRTPINALSSTLSKIQSSKYFRKLRELAKAFTKKIGKGTHEWAAKVDEYMRGMIGPAGSTLFEELGLYYIGPIDGNKIEDLICVLQEVASLDSMGPVLIHVLTNGRQKEVDILKSEITEKISEDSFRADSFPSAIRPQTYSDCFVEALSALAEKDKDIVVVHAGMGMDSSLVPFQDMFPDRFFEVGMAEQHAVTFAAGLACGGLKPFCIIPSAFLQRAYDQIVHDVDRQRVPVRFAITGAGLISAGPVFSGPFDVTSMSCLPNMVVMAPSDETELYRMVVTAAAIDDRPVCFRFPSGAFAGSVKFKESPGPIEIGKGRVLLEGKDVALLGYGEMVKNCFSASSLLDKLGIEVTVADARFCKPLDIELVRRLCRNHSFLITVEEGSVGGFGSHVAQFLALDGKLDGSVKWRPIVLPDTYIESASTKEQLTNAGLTGHHIAATVLSLLGRTREALLLMR